MKTLITAIVLAVTATSASAYTCKNTVEMINGEWSYTSSQCGNQAPASAEVLEMITYIANNPPKDNVEEETVTVIIDNVVVEIPLTKLEKLTLREGKLTVKNHALMAKLRKMSTKFGGSNPEKAIKLLNESIYHYTIGKGNYSGKQLAESRQLSNYDNWSTKAKDRATNMTTKMLDIREKKNKVEARIAKLSK